VNTPFIAPIFLSSAPRREDRPGRRHVRPRDRQGDVSRELSDPPPSRARASPGRARLRAAPGATRDRVGARREPAALRRAAYAGIVCVLSAIFVRIVVGIAPLIAASRYRHIAGSSEAAGRTGCGARSAARRARPPALSFDVGDLGADLRRGRRALTLVTRQACAIGVGQAWQPAPAVDDASICEALLSRGASADRIAGDAVARLARPTPALDAAAHERDRVPTVPAVHVETRAREAARPLYDAVRIG